MENFNNDIVSTGLAYFMQHLGRDEKQLATICSEMNETNFCIYVNNGFDGVLGIHLLHWNFTAETRSREFFFLPPMLNVWLLNEWVSVCVCVSYVLYTMLLPSLEKAFNQINWWRWILQCINPATNSERKRVRHQHSFFIFGIYLYFFHASKINEKLSEKLT